MRLFVLQLFRFIGLFSVLYILFFLFLLPRLMVISQGPNIKDQVDQSFKNALNRDYDILVLGNSRTYRGINPDLIEIPTYNFSLDNDTYNQLYYKLKYLKTNNKKFKALILGMDYFQFSFISDTRNYAYASYFDSDYLNDYPSKNYVLLYHLRKLKPNRAEGLRFPRKNRPYLKQNGQFYREGKATPNDRANRDISRKEIQVKYFENILNYCAENNIKVFLLFLPTRENEMKSYTDNQIKEFHNFLDQYLTENVFLLNFTNDTTYSIDDFADITHLTPKAADRFSKQLNDTIMAIYLSSFTPSILNEGINNSEKFINSY